VAGWVAFDRDRVHPEHNLALLSELERVTYEIREHLPETEGVADQSIGNFGYGMGNEFDVLLDDRGPERFSDLL
jgi:hypothetical protein